MCVAQASGEGPVTENLKKLRERHEVQNFLGDFIHHNNVVRNKIVKRLKEIRHRMETSQFFVNHEVNRLCGV